MTNRLKIVFLGSGEFGVPTLAALAKHHDVVMVVSQPDRPAGRGGKLSPTPISRWAEEKLPGVPLLKPENINDFKVTEQVRGAKADAWVVIAFGQKLSKPLLEGIFAVNLHGSILPKWRGAAPINWAILAGDKVAGNSAITLAEKMDAGLILGTTERPLEPSTTAGELHDLLRADGPDLILKVLADHAAGTLKSETQDESKVTKARKLSRADGWVDFSKTAEECQRWIHGLTPWPGVKATLNNVQFKFLRVAVGEPRAGNPGELLDVKIGLVACGNGTTLQLLELQPAGGKPMSWQAYDNGHRPGAGMMLVSTPEKAD